MITEIQLEQFCLNWFREEGYEYFYGPDLSYDRNITSGTTSKLNEHSMPKRMTERRRYATLT